MTLSSTGDMSETMGDRRCAATALLASVRESMMPSLGPRAARPLALRRRARRRPSRPRSQAGRDFLRGAGALSLMLALASAIAMGSGAACAQVCAADCDGSSSVEVDELLGCIGIALERTPVTECAPC